MVNRFIASVTRKITFPGQCILCTSSCQSNLDICIPCQSDLPEITHPCHRCALPLQDSHSILCGQCLLQPPPFTKTIAVWQYLPPVAQLISGFKYHHRYPYGAVLATLSQKKLTSAYQKEPLPDLICPTPMHWRRRLTRGFNHSEQLARHYCQQLGIPLHHAVKRQKATTAQRSLDAQQRHQNLKGAFTVAEQLKDKSIALVDDVMTTGATASEISRCLLAAGAAEVHVWCLARTPL